MQIANAGFPWDCAPLLMDRIISQPATRRSAPTTILAGTDCVIIAGHGRLLAARKLGMKEVPVIVLDGLNENQRRALILADNKLALNAGWDEEALRLEIEALQDADYDLNLIGFEDEELVRLLESQDANGGLTDEDAVPELQEIPISLPGDLWRLGDHRVLCGDATARAEVERLIRIRSCFAMQAMIARTASANGPTLRRN